MMCGAAWVIARTYDLSAARTARELALLRRWAAYQGRRVDVLMRTLPVEPDTPYAEAVQAVQDGLRRGAAATHSRRPSAWHLAQKAMVTPVDDPALSTHPGVKRVHRRNCQP